MFRVFYLVFLWGVECVMSFLVIILAFKKKYRHSLPARFFLFSNRISPEFQSFEYWFHSCSLGETASLKPLLVELASKQRCNVLITTTTQTGFNQALAFKQEFRNSLICEVCYLPFEPLLMFWAKPTQKLFVLEAEFWYELFFIAKAKGAKTYLLNARISERSYPKYLRFAWFYRRLFTYVDCVFAQSIHDKKRLAEIGANHIQVSGNLKLLNQPVVQYKFTPTKRPLVVLASTHKGEETMLLDVLKQTYRTFNKTEPRIPPFILAVIPRHPERFDEVSHLLESFCQEFSLSFSRRSQSENITTDIFLGDSLGELIEFYAIASLVVLCGSFLPIGGHNPLEVAYFRKPLVSGKEIFNQIPLFEAIKNANLIDIQELPQKIQHLDKLPPTYIQLEMNPQDFFNAIYS
ncbi:3-deoxy-D-manno-octulosonic acid transferase [Helicobacter monodelphidis]|uniref:lipid IV(A) 3-deoxy-D-manno-octulosonic acid transferase n=1 Tax=Helicobacter sp. 15-1451 TaxID=2004995 RepID=UPI000DCD796C|nr:lipid IV(A) 3-deoxy-D-manno-octulosonic acid transferase [Helicobacter sp. 15-1451]RAX57985.1 3-deoxy-D-manno-octulosonic acid transferase [Helicobacter sp. 15-1451]